MACSDKTLVQSISYGCAYIGGQNSDNYSTVAWRVPWGLQMIPAVMLFFLMFFLPESPRWLARKDRWEEAHDVLARVHAKGDLDHPFVLLELHDIKEMCEFERRHKNVTYLDLLKPNMLNRTMIGLFMQIWSQLTGMNVMSTYSTFFSTLFGRIAQSLPFPRVLQSPADSPLQCTISAMFSGWLAILVMPDCLPILFSTSSMSS